LKVPKKFAEVFGGGFLENWTQVSKTRKPVIAAVNGHALGGGCEVREKGRAEGI
jgi:enoyl-CoA hydratase